MPTSIQALAIRYVEARDEHRRLKAERAALYCDHEELTPFDPTKVVLPTDIYVPRRAQRDACWKGHYETRGYVDNVHDVWVHDVDPPDWCDPCKARQAIHEQIKPAQRRMAGRMSALIAAVRALPADEVSNE